MAIQLYEKNDERLFWHGPGEYAPRQIHQPWQHIEWHFVPPGTLAYSGGLGTPTKLESIPDGFEFICDC